MTNSTSSSRRLSANKLLLGLLLMFALAGFLDASYLSVSYVNNVAPVCVIAHGCDVVTTSVYAKLGNAPIALLGLAYYFVGFGLLLVYAIADQRVALKMAAGLFSAGLLFSIWLVYLQLAVIKAICIYCMTSAAITVILFLVSMLLLKFSTPKKDPVDAL